MSRRQLLHATSPQAQGVTFLYQLQHIVEELALWTAARERLPRHTNGKCEAIDHVHKVVVRVFAYCFLARPHRILQSLPQVFR